MSGVKVEFGALWVNENEKGTWMNGKLVTGDKILVVKNDRKSTDKHPDWLIKRDFDSPDNLGAIWERKTKAGKPMLSGKMEDGKTFVAFQNMYRTEDNKQPFWNMIEAMNNG